jgi:hypothetical protein
MVLTSTKRSLRDKSAPHKEAASLLQVFFPGMPIFEEVFLPGCGLYLDIFVPNLSIGIEIHGRQHFEYTPYFHKTKADFLMACKRDREKAEWCRINDIDLIVLPDGEEDKWKNLISSAISRD